MCVCVCVCVCVTECEGTTCVCDTESVCVKRSESVQGNHVGMCTSILRASMCNADTCMCEVKSVCVKGASRGRQAHFINAWVKELWQTSVPACQRMDMNY